MVLADRLTQVEQLPRLPAHRALEQDYFEPVEPWTQPDDDSEPFEAFALRTVSTQQAPQAKSHAIVSKVATFLGT